VPHRSAGKAYIVAAGTSLLLTCLFFIEHIPPFKKIHFWSDIEGYHYPLLNYIFKSLHEGRLPLWDWSIYCGMPLAGNIQAALFYPPNWLLFAGSLWRSGLPYTWIELLAIAHVWVAAWLSFVWLRARTHHWLPAAAGAGVIAYSGYMLSQLNHLGVTNAFAWMPLGLWGIDEASRTRAWRPLWKLAAASGLCMLAGYPATWVTFAVVSCVYAVTLAGGPRLAAKTVCALALGLALSAVALLPALEAAYFKVLEPQYGRLEDWPKVYASFVLPNFYNQNRATDGPDFQHGSYYYLGAAGLFGLVYFLRRPRIAGALTAMVVAAVCFFVTDNTWQLLNVVHRVPILADAVRGYTFPAGLVLAVGLLAALTIGDFLRREGKRRSIPMKVWAPAAGAWAIYEGVLWARGGKNFLAGPQSGVYAAVTLVLLFAGLAVYRAKPSAVAALLLLATLFVEYKAFGTNRRFSAVSGDLDSGLKDDIRSGGPTMLGVSAEAQRRLLQKRDYRLALAQELNPVELRHYGLTTPQGFDPFLSRQYQEAVERFTAFRTNRLFNIDPRNEAMLRYFGVGFVMTRTPLEAITHLKRLGQGDAFFQVYEYVNAEPAWKFAGDARAVRWTPGHREFEGCGAGRFLLREQFWPGWKASAGGRPLELTRCEGAFQCAEIPAGPRRVVFRYDPSSVKAGALLSASSCAALMLFLFWRRTPARGARSQSDGSDTSESSP
jgi:hypothetical protein